MAFLCQQAMSEETRTFAFGGLSIRSGRPAQPRCFDSGHSRATDCVDSDFAFLTVKTQDVQVAVQSNLSFLRDVPLVTFQNGVRSDEIVASLIPRDQIISAVVNTSASYLTPGTVLVARLAIRMSC